MVKLINILKEIYLNLKDSYPYTLSKSKNTYTAVFSTEDDYQYEYLGNVKNQILGIDFEVTNKPGAEQDIERTEKSIDKVWLRIGLGLEDHTKEFFNFETKKGILNVNDVKWDKLWIPIKKYKTFINYVKSNFSSFNGKYIDLNKLSSYNINELFIELSNKSIKGTKIISGEQEIIISLNPEYDFLEIYYKLDLDKLNEKLLDVIKPYIKLSAKAQHVGTHITTNKGNIFKIMNTIFQITKEIIDSNNKIKYIGFTPALTDKERAVGIKLDQSKRTKLYDLYIKNIYPNSYILTGEELKNLPYSEYRIIYKII